MSMSQAGELNSSPLWPRCQCCQRRDNCPYVCDQLICHAACRGHGSAQALALEAQRQTELLSRNVGISCLLCIDRSLEHKLAQELQEELAVMDSFYTQP